AVTAGDGNRERVRSRQLRPSGGRREAPRRRRRQGRDETALGELAHPVAEHPGREGPPRDDQPRVLRTVHERGLDDGRQGQIAERAVAVPALVLVLVHLPPRARLRIDVREGLEPVDAREPVTGLAVGLGEEEVVGERPRRAVVEPQRVQPLKGIHYDRTVSGFTMPPGRNSATRSAIAAISGVTSGSPESPASRSCGSSGIRPRSGTPSSSASRLPPPVPKTSPLMFSMTPS